MSSIAQFWGKIASFLNYTEDDMEQVDLREAPKSAQSVNEGKVVALPMATQSRIALVSPQEFNDCQRITDKLLAQNAVIVDLEELPENERRGLVDFLNGAVYAIQGRVQRISAKHYLYCPPSVQMILEGEEDAFEPETAGRLRGTAFSR